MIEAVAAAADLPAADRAPRGDGRRRDRERRGDRLDARRRRARADSPSRSSSRSHRCSRSRRTTSRMRWRAFRWRRWSGSSTARACRCTRTATTCASTRAPATTSPPPRPRSWRRSAARSAQTLILDGEAIALKPDGAPYPFQDTMRRFGRVLDIEAMRASMPLSVFFFDCLRRDDERPRGDARAARASRR